MKWFKILLLLVAGFTLISFSNEIFAQCSQCKMLAEQSASDDEILGAKSTTINTAILYIMTIPYIILAILFRHQLKRLFKKLIKSTSKA